MKHAAIILAGGAGTRLWPLSSDANPKQFLELFDGESLLQRTWTRIARVIPEDAIYISTNERYRSRCLEQLPRLKPKNVIAEPARRNTAPAIALACLAIAQERGDPTIGIFPSDHAITDVGAFASTLQRGLEYAGSHEVLATFAIAATEPHTGYGYLELGDEVAPGVVALRRFVEKPSLELAQEYVRRGGFAWNAGMFIWRASVFRDVLRSTAPQILDLAMQIVANPERTAELYAQMPDVSVDYAVLEKAPRVVALPATFDWSDVGSWAAVTRFSKGTAAVVHEGEDVFVHSAGERKIAVIGASNLIVVESEDGILVLDRNHAESLSKIVKSRLL